MKEPEEMRMAERRVILTLQWRLILEEIPEKNHNKTKSSETGLKLYWTYIFGSLTEDKEHGPEKAL
jgi:hypothetical protein